MTKVSAYIPAELIPFIQEHNFNISGVVRVSMLLFKDAYEQDADFQVKMNSLLSLESE